MIELFPGQGELALAKVAAVEVPVELAPVAPVVLGMEHHAPELDKSEYNFLFKAHGCSRLIALGGLG
jgi:hypothetical protein